MRSVVLRALVLTGFVLLAACGGDGKKARQSCDSEGQCEDGLCFQSECYQACTRQDQCTGDEICVHRVAADEAADVCVVASEYGGCANDAGCALIVRSACQVVACSAEGLCEVSDAPATEPPCVACETAVDCAAYEAGECREPATCEAGACVRGADLDETGCADGTCRKGVCVPDGEPDCADRECGDDGVGGVCGHCTDCDDEIDDSLCGLDGRCADECCSDCAGKACGDDGCGGSCGGCDDDDACTADSCSADGLCQHDAKICGDDNACTVDTCADGACAHELTPVDVPELCNSLDDNCNGLTDEEGCGCESAADCDDDNVCTDDGCDPSSGCQHEPNTAPCGAGKVCQGGSCVSTCADLCAAGTRKCEGAAYSVCGDADADGCTEWGPGLACDNGKTCQGGVCVCPGAGVETCNGVDDDCDGATDEDFPNLGLACDGTDADLCAKGTYECDPTGLGLQCVGDVAAVELCNGVDDDCDGQTDEDASDCTVYYTDVDSDAWGVQPSQCRCSPGGVYRALQTGDCDDAAMAVNPGAPEKCSTPGDDNCNGDKNDAGAAGCTLWYADGDGDTYGGGVPRCQCAADGTYPADSADDCDDGDEGINPGAVDYTAAACVTEQVAWTTDAVTTDPADYRQSSTLVIDSEGLPHLLWDGLVHAVRPSPGAAWTVDRTVVVAGNSPSAELDPQGGIVVLYTTDTWFDLSLARYDGGVWSAPETIDVDYSRDSMALAVDAEGFSHVAYTRVIATATRVHYATNRSGAWTSMVVDPDVVSGTVALAVDAAGYPHVVYYDGESTVWLATNRSGIWTRETIVLDANVPTYYVLRIAFDDGGNRHVTYSSAGADGAVYSVLSEKAGVWTSTAIQPIGKPVYDLRLATDASGALHVAYSGGIDTDGHYDVMYGTNRSGSWRHASVSAAHDWGLSLRVDAAGGALIAWDHDHTDYGLRLSTGVVSCLTYGLAGDSNCDGLDGTDADGDNVASTATGGLDCDDTDDTIVPGTTEACDGIDNDCDGGVDEACDADTDGVDDNADGQGRPGDDPCRAGAASGCDDNCRGASNPLQEDADADGVGDVCDPDFGI